MALWSANLNPELLQGVLEQNAEAWVTLYNTPAPCEYSPYTYIENRTVEYKPGFMFEERPLCAGYRRHGILAFLTANPDAQKVSFSEGLSIIRADQ